MKRVSTVTLIAVLLGMVVITGCLGGGNAQSAPSTASSASSQISAPPVSTAMTPATTTAPPRSWKMELVWNVSTSGIPFMDMGPDGSLSAVIDWERAYLYLVKPDGESVAFDVQGEDPVKPVIAGVIVKGRETYVLASYADFAGVRVYSWRGQRSEERHGWAGSVADGIARSPSGNHTCYLITPNAGKQELYCDGKRLNLGSDEYELHSVSDSGVVVLGIGDKSLVLKEGEKLLEINSGSVIAYRDKLIASEDGKLRVYSLSGEVLAERKGYTFRMTTLMRWTLVPTAKYLFRYEPLEDTSVLTWNLTELRTLPGFPYFANENFVVMGDGKSLHCYSLEDFHEVFSVEVPGDIGYVKLSNDGRVLLVSGETGGFWLYRATASG
ncbi:hypothetical protein [Thermococcus sp.]|uniref:hypothetical protein n=1 Tax=Thermococcus sp. TaxID=35749 RepID=UPI002606BB52|nr:hypothetical protein [Thermococcus sp.]